MKHERSFPKTVLFLITILITALSFTFLSACQTVMPPQNQSSAISESKTGGEASTTNERPSPTVSPTATPSSESTSQTSSSIEETSEETGTSEPPAPIIQNPNPLDPMEEGPFPQAVKMDGDGRQVRILAGGDVLMHSYLINGGLREDGSYNYDYAFRHLPALTDRADLSIVNMEGTIAGAPYTGFPLFSAPDAIASAIRSGGFDMALTANNHMIDKGTAGLIRTVDVLEDNGLLVSGTRRSKDEPFYQLVNIGGIRIAFATFTYETIRQNGSRALNALIIPKDAEGLINSFSMEEPYMSRDFERMARLARTMRDNGADAVVFNIHWGTEYNTSENWYQATLSQKLADSGVDLILGFGPHVIQPVKEIKASSGDHRMLVFYSVGNLLSDQLFGTADSNGFAEDGLLAEVLFTRLDDGKVVIGGYDYIETYCYKIKTDSNKTRNTIVPIRLALADPAAYEIEGAEELLRASLARTESIMAGNQLESISKLNTIAD